MFPRMRAVIRAIALALLGAVTGVVLLVTFYRSHAAIVLEMDRELPGFTSGFHALERDGDRTFVWTSDRAVVRLAGLDRRSEWVCTAHARGPRAAGEPAPQLTFSFDGTGGAVFALDHDYRDLSVTVPARPDRPGLTLTLSVTPVFTPGGGDPRTLGAQIDRLACEPRAAAWPPTAAWRQAAHVTGAFGLALGLAGASLALALGSLIVVAAGVAFLLATHGGAFGDYPALVALIGVTAAAAVAIVAAVQRLRGRPGLAESTLAALSFSAVFAALKLAALAHPAKATVDALFQAHRLDWVLAGRYFFTQPLPDGVAFPYAIGLYMTAAPGASLMADHVLLLRVVVVLAEAVAGLLLFGLVARRLDDPPAGAIAVVLFHLIPVSFVVVGNGNLTNAFAQSVALMAVAAAARLTPGPLDARAVMGLAIAAGLTAVAFLSHVSTVMLLAASLGAIIVALLLWGGAAWRSVAVRLAVAAVVAAVVAVALYYRHFGDVAAQFVSRVSAASAESAAGMGADAPAILVRQLAWHERVIAAARETEANIGWPVLALAAVGVWHLARSGWRRPHVLFMLAWTASWLALVVSGTLTRVDTQYQRYAVEFIGRINLACYPLAAALAATGVAHLWRSRVPAARVLAAVGFAAALTGGAAMWCGWTG